jgi:hypothetical protein
VLLISDVDDTVKITHVRRRLRAVVRGLFRRTVYGGMAALYREMAADIVFLSGSPQFLEKRLHRTLVHRSGFPAGRFILRNWLTERDIVAFKRRHLAAVLDACPTQAILIGDDTEHDPELFREAASKARPGQVAAIYIRQNLHQPLPADVVGFATAFDLALHEHLAGRLQLPQVVRVAEAVIAAGRAEVRLLWPAFYARGKAHQPPHWPALVWEHATLAPLAREIESLMKQGHRH